MTPRSSTPAARWRGSFRWGWVQRAAVRNGITAWDDHRHAVPGVQAPAPPQAFAWISQEAQDQAVADLERAATEHDRDSTPPPAPVSPVPATRRR
ncbi:hypothetical protein [Streptomyces sp. GSL17-111]|uniref:hypothetical protein n=1 Tax=Streptomyces sp. GSL17-111 TaxID=3121596 RepID=UPI0030F42EC7